MKRFLLVLFSVVVVLGIASTVSFAETGACCLLDGTCTEGTEEDCNTVGGVYQGDDTDCTMAECPSVQITDVSVDRQPDPTYQRGDSITYTVEYVIHAVLSATYDVKSIVKPRFGKGCKKEPPKTGRKGTAKGEASDVDDGSHVMTIDYRPNNAEKHYVIPQCANEDKHVTVKYIIKLYNPGTTELVAKDVHIERKQVFVEATDGGGGCYCHF